MGTNSKNNNTKKRAIILGIILLFAITLSVAIPMSLAETKAAEHDAALVPEDTEQETEVPVSIPAEKVPEFEPETEEAVPEATDTPDEPTEEQSYVASTKTLVYSDEPLQMNEVPTIVWYDTTDANFAQFLEGEGTITVKTMQCVVVRADAESSTLETPIGACFGFEPGYEVGTIITLYILLG